MPLTPPTRYSTTSATTTAVSMRRITRRPACSFALRSRRALAMSRVTTWGLLRSGQPAQCARQVVEHLVTIAEAPVSHEHRDHAATKLIIGNRGDAMGRQLPGFKGTGGDFANALQPRKPGDLACNEKAIHPRVV